MKKPKKPKLGPKPGPGILSRAKTMLQKITSELKKRYEAKHSFEKFARYMTDQPLAKHHKYLAKTLEKVRTGEIKRLMVFMPPGHAKSTYSSYLFAPYFMGHHPDKTVIMSSHTLSLSARFGRKVRNLMLTPKFKNIFGFGVSSSCRSSSNWETEKGGEYFAIGVGGAVTGRRADLAIIDDPIKGHEQADSHHHRQKLWNWYLSDLRTRLKPDARIILIQTRWHEDDLAGRILDQEEGENWHVINLPALAEDNDPMGRKPGEALWPEWLSKDMLLEEKRAQTPRNWDSLYQQRPTSEDGCYFESKWIRYYEQIPALQTLKIYGASDYAVTSNGGDYTVHGVIGVDPNDDIYVLDWWSGQTSSDIWVESFLDLMQKYNPIIWGEESGQIIKSIGPFIKKRQLERKIYGIRKQYPSTADKASRARAIQARMAMGKVYFPYGVPWAQEVITQALKFPNTLHDDHVDVLSLFGRMLLQLHPGKSAQDDKRPASPLSFLGMVYSASRNRRLIECD